MPRLTPYAAHEIAMVSSTPAGSGFPIGLMPGALPSDHASRQTLKTTAVRLPLGHSQFAGLVMPRHAPRFPGHVISVVVGRAKARQSKSAVADFDTFLSAEVGQARLRCAVPTGLGRGGHAEPVIGPAEGWTRWL